MANKLKLEYERPRHERPRRSPPRRGHATTWSLLCAFVSIGTGTAGALLLVLGLGAVVLPFYLISLLSAVAGACAGVFGLQREAGRKWPGVIALLLNVVILAAQATVFIITVSSSMHPQRMANGP